MFKPGVTYIATRQTFWLARTNGPAIIHIVRVTEDTITYFYLNHFEGESRNFNKHIDIFVDCEPKELTGLLAELY